MNHGPAKKTIAGIALLATLFALILCTRDKEKASITAPIVKPGPTLTLLQPADGDTTLPDTINKYRISATITLASGVDLISLLINSTDYTDSVNTAQTQFAATMTLAADTTRFWIEVKDENNKIARDTVSVFRVHVEPAIPMNKAVLSGAMYRPSASGVGKRLAKAVVAQNASGKTAEVSNVLPLSGADVLLYKADTNTTASYAATKTDSTGHWNAEVAPGNYFIFAVWFDQQNLELITASIQNVSAEAGKRDTTEEKVALTDDVAPLVLSFMDAQAADDNNIFLASNIPQGLPIVVNFSEPMNRISAGEDTTGVVLGEIDPTDANLAFKSKVACKKLWSATSKELQIIPTTPLTIGKYYKVVIPATLKDLALNKLTQAYTGIFSVIARADLLPYTVMGATLKNGDTISSERIIEISFSRSINGIYLNRNFTLSPKVNCYFEAKGPIARLAFPVESGLVPNTNYTLSIARGAQDLLGDTLTSAYSVTFYTKPALMPQQGASSQIGKLIAFFTATMEAYIAKDFERFAQSFHPLLEMVSIWTDSQGEQSQRQTLDEFLQGMRNDAASSKQMAMEGVLFPKIYHKTIGSDSAKFRKLIAKSGIGTAAAGTSLYIEDMGEGGFRQPRALDSTGADISTQVRFSKDTVFFNNNGFIQYIPDDFAMFSDDASKRDPNYFGKLQNTKTNIEMENVKITTKESYSIRSIDSTKWNSAAPSATILFDMVSTTLQSNNPQPITNAMAISMTIISENGRLAVRTLVSRELFRGTQDQFSAKKDTILNSTAFNPDSFKVQGTKAIELFAPAQKAVKVVLPVVFKWSKVAGVNNYILGLSNEFSGGNAGMLVFTGDTTVSIGAKGEVTGGTVLTIDPSKLTFPMPHFSARLMQLDSTRVYVWKVVGIIDSTADNIGMGLKLIADSDFRPARQPGYFTIAPTMPDMSQMFTNTAPTTTQPIVSNDFMDSDGDGYPDWIEKAVGTNPRDQGSKPAFNIDSDKDGIADFFETQLGFNPDSASSKPTDANNNHIPDALESRTEWDPRLAKDSDNDGFPDEVEILLKTDPWNAQSKPQEVVKGSAPVGSYRGIFLIEAEKREYLLAVTILADSLGVPKVRIDSTRLDIIRAGETAALQFMSGEWVFYSKILSGANAGKFFKIRMIPGFQQVNGMVDMADMINGGGPLVGRFMLRIDGMVGSLLGSTLPPTGTTTPTNTIGVPPTGIKDALKTPPAGSKPIVLTVSKDPTTGRYTAALTLDNGAAIPSNEAIWQPQAFPMYLFRFKKDTADYKIEGALFRDAEGAYLGGGIQINGKYAFDYALYNKTGAIEDPTKGPWNGIAMGSNFINTQPTTQGPLAFVGARDVLAAALALTNNKGMMIGDSSAFLIRGFWQEGVWKVKDSVGNRAQILEKPGDPANVFVGKDRSGSDVVILTRDATGGTVVNQPTIMFKGGIVDVQAALRQSGGIVKVLPPNSPTGFDATADTATLRQVTNPQQAGTMIFQINDRNSGKSYVFLADAMNGKLMFMENKPEVMEVGSSVPTAPTTIKMAPFTGAIGEIQNALAASANLVRVWQSNGAIFEGKVNPATLRTSIDAKRPEVQIYKISDVGDTAKIYMFMGDSTGLKLMIEFGKPTVTAVGSVNQPLNQGPPMPYTGSITEVQTALMRSFNSVRAVMFNSTTQVDANVNPGSLRAAPNPSKPGTQMCLVNDANDAMKIYMVMGDQTGKLWLENNMPLVTQTNSGTQPPVNSKMAPFTGAIGEIQTALTTSGTVVRVAVTAAWLDARVNPASLRPFVDPLKPAMQMYQATDAVENTKNYLFMGDSSGTQLMLGDGKPIVTLIPGSTQPPVNQGPPVPYSGPIAVIQPALTASGNLVMAVMLGDSARINVRVNPATVQAVDNPAKPGTLICVVTDANNTAVTYQFMADQTGKLWLENGKPLVSQAGGAIQPPTNQPMPFSGAIGVIQTALTGSANGVREMVQGSAAMTEAVVDPTTLQAMDNPQKPGTQLYTVADTIIPARRYIFMADSQTGQLIINNGKPVVTGMTTAP
jgi:hypothetical protein